MRPRLALLPAVLAAISVASTSNSAAAQQHAVLSAPAISAPSDGLPYAIDSFKGQPELVPVHLTPVKQTFQEPSAAASSSTGRGAVGELEGTHARTVLHGATPAFYIHLDATASTHRRDSSYAIVRAFPAKDLRVFAQVRSTEADARPKHIVGLIASTTQALPDGWVKITPKAGLAPGEYALNPVPGTHTFSKVVFDFRIDPAAPNAPDVVVPPDAAQSAQ